MSPLLNIRLLAAVMIGLAVLVACAYVVLRLVLAWGRRRHQERPGFDVMPATPREQHQPLER